MPSVSKAQSAAMWAAREGKSTLGIPQSVGKDFTEAQAPGSVKKLPMRVGPKAPAGTKSIGRKPFGSWAV